MPAASSSRLAVPLAAALLFFGACGDDKKATDGGRRPATPPTTPTFTPTVFDEGAGSPSPDTGLAPADVKVGDWVTWEVRVAGQPGKTTVTWRAMEVVQVSVKLRVESKTTDEAGKEVAASSTESWVPVPRRRKRDPLPAGVAPKTVTVAGRKIVTSAPEQGEERAGIAYAEEVPLGGVAWSVGPGGVEQTVVGFGRGS